MNGLSQHWGQPCWTVLLLISVGVGCASLKGKFTSSLISMISHRFAGNRSRSPPASVSTLLAQLVTGPHVMQPWLQDAIMDEFLLCLPPWLSSTAGASHSHIAGGERYSELWIAFDLFWFKLRITSRKVPPARTLLKHMLNFHQGLMLISGDETLAYSTVCAEILPWWWLTTFLKRSLNDGFL